MLLYPLGVDLELEGVQLVARLESWTPKLHFEDRKALFEEIMESNKTYKQLSHEEKQSVMRWFKEVSIWRRIMWMSGFLMHLENQTTIKRL